MYSLHAMYPNARYQRHRKNAAHLPSGVSDGSTNDEVQWEIFTDLCTIYTKVLLAVLMVHSLTWKV